MADAPRGAASDGQPSHPMVASVVLVTVVVLLILALSVASGLR